MTYQAVQPRAGIFTDQAPADASGFYASGSNVRFVQGRAETIGGWQKKTATQATGIPRKIKSWAQIDGNINTGLASASALQIDQGGTLYDITPERASGSLTNPFDTTDTSTTVTVNHSSHGLATGARVIFDSASAVGGITIDGEYTATKVDDNSYTITHSSAATSTVSGGGGSPNYSYLINPGETNSVYQFGWGIGAWNAETWGTARSASDTTLAARIWSLEPWGEDLIAAHNIDGTVYYGEATTGTSVRASALSNAPTASFVMVSPETRHLICFGAGGDPLKIQWCEQDNLTSWTASATNDAGDQRLVEGSEIRAAIRARGAIIVLTDVAAYEMSYIGGQYVWRFRRIGSTGPVMGVNAIAESDGVVAWICEDGTFRYYNGSIQTLDCPVRKRVFDNINLVQRVKVTAGVNASYQEIAWFYPSAGQDEPDKAVVWSYGQGSDVWWLSDDIDRTAWDAAGVIKTPLGVGSDGYIYEHETGASADGSNLTAFVETGDVDIQNGDELYNVGDIIPDMVLQGADASNKVNLTLKSRVYPLGDQTTNGPHEIDSTTQKLSGRATGRQIAYRLESASQNLFWRAGKMRFDVTLNGGTR